MSKRLGKGLDALIPSLSINDDDKIVEIPLSQLRANPYQPRKDFNEESIQELAESIRQHGVIQPIIVRSVLKGYEIIAGERRFRASQICGNQPFLRLSGRLAISRSWKSRSSKICSVKT